jgi:hypothetical protein
MAHAAHKKKLAFGGTYFPEYLISPLKGHSKKLEIIIQTYAVKHPFPERNTRKICVHLFKYNVLIVGMIEAYS